MLHRHLRGGIAFSAALLGWIAPASSAPAAVAIVAEPHADKAAPQEAVYRALNGPWIGALEYRDYSSNGRVALPTIVDIRRTKDGKSLILHYIYDDGPTKVVDDFETVTVDSVAGTFITVSGDGKDTSSDKLSGLADFAKSGQGQLIRHGEGKENGKSVAVRTTLTLSPRTLTILKETQVPGQAFIFRDQYTLTRVGFAMTGQ